MMVFSWSDVHMLRQPLAFRCERDRLILPAYPFPARKKRVIHHAAVVEVVDWFPFALRLVDGEFLCVSRAPDDEAALRAWCAAHGVPIVERFDAWASILDPFLDTQHSPDYQAGNLRLLAEAGMDRAEVERLRARVEKPMLSLTAMTWEWECYGLYDVLCALKPRVLTGAVRWWAFYAEAMAVAARGCDGAAIPPTPGAPAPPSSR